MTIYKPKNPYPTLPGFGLRVHHAAKSIRKLADEPWANIYTRGFDNCFEQGDGDAVVFALMHKAYAERSENCCGRSQLAEGIAVMFRGRLSLDGFPQSWEAVAWSREPSTESVDMNQMSLTV
ncbi:hypothetical protein FF011L_12300 [Roseimaritima multifibrata]|uniref:Uncharacterized protein n=1 Tax=Roseimaritima multifibrata TaxID=1930274 RepID=A0A517MCJ2_9BACT|nr:hypothetical protein [Roseimaritima multifibrata]QDS92487.1 hypothetical protein FF011L_12300 [Roseimaritima multifibrata]